MKVVIFDSGPLINFSMNGLLDSLSVLNNQFEGKFVISPSVHREFIDRPLKIKQFELGALRISHLLEQGVLVPSQSLGVSDEELDRETKALTDKANHFLKSGEYWIHLVSEAEMSCFALATILKKRGIESMIAMDERTARMLSEKPDNLRDLMSQKLHRPLEIVAPLGLTGYSIIRSSELVYILFKKGIIPLTDARALEALLYATKFKGSAISFEEIEELKRL